MSIDDSASATLATAWGALRAGRDADALDALAQLPADLSPGTGARVEAWRAQALRGLGRVEEAGRAGVLALRLAKQAGDIDGVRELRGLQAGIVASLAHHRMAEAERARDADLVGKHDDALLAGIDEDEERAQRLLRRGQAELDGGDAPAALRSFAAASAYAERAGVPRPQVLALLARARACASQGDDAAVEASIHAAHALADASDDMNLVTAVAHAARAVNVRLTPPAFG
jgi:tetratricopeptide (TPR) repeat protein